MTEEAPAVARATRHFELTADQVFDAWTVPELASRWVLKRPQEEQVRIEIDGRVGGRYSFVARRDGIELDHTGEYREFERPRKLVFSWGVPAFKPDNAEITIEITPGESGCDASLTAEMKPAYADFVEQASRSWRIMLDAIATAFEPASSQAVRRSGCLPARSDRRRDRSGSARRSRRR